MAVSKIILGGYKSFRERTEIPIAPLTLLFGPNSSGKSTVLQAAGLLREELKQTPADRRDLASLIGMLADGPARYVHRLPHNGVLADPVLVPLTLGVEIDPVSTEIGTTNPDDQWNVARQTATQLYWGLAGTRVRLEFTTKAFAFATKVAVDGQMLLEIVDSNTWSQYLKLRGTAAESKNAKPARKKEPRKDIDSLGAVSLNIDHPLWTVDPRMALELRTLKRLAKGAKSQFVREQIRLDENKLILRAGTTVFGAEGSTDPYLVLRRLADLQAASSTSARVHPDVDKRETIRAARHVDAVCETITFLLLQIRFVAGAELDIAGHVPGDRRVLTKEDASATGARQQEKTAVARYATWLGVREAGEEALAAGEVPRDDFVNDILRRDLFSPRHYQVKPEVLRIETTGIVERLRDDETNLEHIDVYLYLEDANGRRLDFADVGSGVSYVFPILATLWEAKRSWIEQPELHLHPAAQCELGDVFIRAFNKGRFSIIETHSEHLLLRVLRRIRNTAAGTVKDSDLRCQPETVSVLYFELLEDGSTKVHPLRVSRSGDFMDRWPAGFFEERDRELFDE